MVTHNFLYLRDRIKRGHDALDGAATVFAWKNLNILGEAILKKLF